MPDRTPRAPGPATAAGSPPVRDAAHAGADANPATSGPPQPAAVQIITRWPDSTSQLLTQRQVADVLGVSVRTVARLRQDGRLAVLRVGKSLRFTREAVEACIRPVERPAAQPVPPTIGTELFLSARSAQAWAKRLRVKRGGDLPRPFKLER